MATAAAAQPESLIDLEGGEELTPVSEICLKLTGKRPSPQKVWRWRLKGVRGAKLEAVLIGGSWLTTKRAFADFIRRQTAAAVDASTGSADRDQTTERRLKAAGLR